MAEDAVKLPETLEAAHEIIIDQAEKLQDITAQHNKLNAESKSYAKQVKDAEKLNDQLQNQLAAAQEEPSGKQKLPKVTVDDVKYQFTKPALIHNTKRYKAEEAAANKELCAELVKIGYGGLKKI